MNFDPTTLQETAIKYKKELHRLFYLTLEMEYGKYFTVRDGIKNQEVLTTAFGDFESEPYKGTVNSATIGSAQLRARTITTYLNQTVGREDPRDLYKTAAELVGKVEAGTAARHPLEQLILSLMMQSKGRKMGRNIFSAVFNQAGTTTAECFNGFDTITAADILSGKISAGNNNYAAVTAALTELNIGDQLADIVDNYVLPELKSKDNPRSIRLSIPDNLARMYFKWYKNEFGSVPYNDGYKRLWLHGYDDIIELVSPVGKTGSTLLQLTSKENMIIGTDSLSNDNMTDVARFEPFKWTFTNVANIGCEFESIHGEDFFVIDTNP